MAGNIEPKHERAFRQLLILDSVRGTDSTGVAIIKRSGEIAVAKSVGNAFELVDYSRAYEAGMKGIHRALIGHNRYATQGKINKNNAHPFEYDNVVGAHNGTLGNKYILDQGAFFDVDSMALYNHIDKKGLKSAIKNLDGAWALSWWNKQEQSINLLRNKERPLFICESKDGRTIFWASEWWMLVGALGRNETEYTAPYLLQENLHMKIVVDNQGKFVSEETEEVKSEYAPFVFRGGKTVTHSNIQQQNTGAVNVVDIGSLHAYAGQKDRELSVVSSRVDANGGCYLGCVDSEWADLEIRLYYHAKSTDARLVGCKIVGNIQPKPFRNGAGYQFFKVEASTAKRVIEDVVTEEDVVAVSAKTFLNTLLEEEDVPTIYDARGNPITEKDFKAKYGSCCWCTSPIDMKESYDFTKDDEVLCQDCAVDAEVRKYSK